MYVTGTGNCMYDASTAATRHQPRLGERSKPKAPPNCHREAKLSRSPSADMIKRHVILNAGSKMDIRLCMAIWLLTSRSSTSPKHPFYSFSGFTHQQRAHQLIICFFPSGIDSCRVPNATQRHSCAVVPSQSIAASIKCI